MLTALLTTASAQAAQASADDPEGLGDLSIEEVMELRIDRVFSASRYEQKVTRAPASVTIVTADEIRKFGYRTLADILRGIAGVYVTNNRNYSFVGFRGFAQAGDFNTGILLLIDGHRVNDAIYNLMYVGQEALIDVDMIERVEIIRGPGSSIYGNSAFFGVIDVVTRSGSRIDGEEVSVSAGSFATYGSSFASGRKLDNGVEYAVSGSFYDSAGQRRLYFPEFDDPSTNDGVAVDIDDESADRWFGSVAYGDFTLSAAWSHRYKSVPTATSGTLFNADTHTRDSRGFLDLKYQHRFEGGLDLTGRLSYDIYPYRALFAYENPAPPPEVVNNRDSSTGQWVRAEMQATQRFEDGNTVIVGGEYQYNLQQEQDNHDVDPYQSYLDIDHHSKSYALYAQSEIEPWRGLLLNAGLRYDRHYAFGDTVNPRVALIYSPLARSTFKAIYGEAFRAPNDYELNYESASFRRNPDLDPETLRSYELVYDQYLPADLRFSASAYRNDIKDLIALQVDDSTGQTRFANLDRVHARGGELQLEARRDDGSLGRLSYTYQSAHHTDGDTALSNSPRHMGKLNVSVPVAASLFGSVEVQYRGQSESPEGEHVGGFTVVNTTLLREDVLPGLTLSLSSYNLLDRRYSTPAGGSDTQERLQQDGRSALLKATYRF